MVLAGAVDGTGSERVRSVEAIGGALSGFGPSFWVVMKRTDTVCRPELVSGVLVRDDKVSRWD